MKKENYRTCIVKKEAFPKHDLIRLVKSKDNILYIDETKKMYGRGVYIHSDSSPIKKLIDKKLLNKIFKININEEFYRLLEEKFIKKG